MKKTLSLLAGLLLAVTLSADSTLHPTPPPHPDAVPDGITDTVHPGVMNVAASGVDPRWNTLVAGWHLDESSLGAGAVSRADVLGNYTLTDNNTVKSSAYGPTGTVAFFEDLNTEYLSNASITLPSAYSMSAWVNADTNERNDIFAYYIGTDATKYIFVRVDGSAIVRFMHAGDGGEVSTTQVGWTVNRWHHIVATFDGVDTIKLYVDGASPSSVSTATTMTITTQLFTLGFVSTATFGGQMANAGLWSRELSAADVADLFNNGEGKKYADLAAATKVGLTGFWDLDEASGNRADDSGNGYTLTDNNTVTSATATPTALSGSAASFVRASNEYLSKTDETALRWGGVPFAVTAWVYPLVADATPQGVVLKDNNSGAGVEYHLQYLTSGTDKFRFRGGGSSTYVYSATAATNAWHFVIVGSDGAGNNFISVDGSALVTAAVTYNGTGGAAALEIGKPSFAAWPFGGLVDEVYLHKNVTVDSDWIDDMYNSGAGRRYPN